VAWRGAAWCDGACPVDGLRRPRVYPHCEPAAAPPSTGDGEGWSSTGSCPRSSPTGMTTNTRGAASLGTAPGRPTRARPASSLASPSGAQLVSCTRRTEARPSMVRRQALGWTRSGTDGRAGKATRDGRWPVAATNGVVWAAVGERDRSARRRYATHPRRCVPQVRPQDRRSRGSCCLCDHGAAAGRGGLRRANRSHGAAAGDTPGVEEASARGAMPPSASAALAALSRSASAGRPRGAVRKEPPSAGPGARSVARTP